MPNVLGKATILSMLALQLAVATDTESPNDPIPKPECDASTTVSIRYSSTSKRLYLESADGSTRGGCVTLKQIWEQRAGKAPLYAVDPDTGDESDTVTGTWLLTEALYVEDGITLKVCGNSLAHVSTRVLLRLAFCEVCVPRIGNVPVAFLGPPFEVSIVTRTRCRSSPATTQK